MGPSQIQTKWWLAVCIWLFAAPALLIGQPQAQFPYTQPQNNPWLGTTPQYPQFPGTQPAAGPTFRPTAPLSSSANPYVNSTAPAWNFGNLFGFGQNTQPFYPNYPIGNPNIPSLGYPYSPSDFPTVQQPFPSGIYPNATPNVLFPGTGGSQPFNSNPYQSNPFQQYGYQQNNFNWNNWWNNTGTNFNNGTNQVIRLFQGPRFRHTWLPGTDGFGSKKPTSLETNDSDVSLVFAIPNFLNSTRPLYVIPSYSQHGWDGPTKPGSDLPGSAFSGFLDAGWETNPQQTLGVELGVRVGIFSAFDAVNSESIRIQGKALGRLRLTPTATLRAGVFYLDRNKIKLLPAGGILWMPNQDTRFDLFFPEPKLAHYVATLGNSDVWWYLSGYYGGGAWTIKQTDGTNDEIDINDIRIMLGLEFGKSDQIRQGFRLGFIEAGYAFNRELIYRVRSSSSLDLDNSFVLRAGFAY